MADDDSTSGIPKVHSVFVRGGTHTSRHDNYYAQLNFEADQRRKAEDERAVAADANPENIHRNALALGGTTGHACIVLALKHPKDGTILDWIICELIGAPRSDGTGIELILNLACPRCIQQGLKMQFAQLKIHQSNRMFYLDEKCRGELWVNPADKNDVYTIAGKITMPEWATCSGCGWRFTIDDSVVRTG